jgi:integrase/recombinase XerD
MPSIYARFKDTNGRWGYERVGRGKPRENATFHIRFTDADGRRQWSPAYDSVKKAKEDTEKTETAVKAQKKGLTVAEFQDSATSGKTLIKKAVEDFLQFHRSARPKTVSQYDRVLTHLLANLPGRVRFVGDLATFEVLDAYHRVLQSEQYSPKTIWNHMGVIFSMLKTKAEETGVAKPSTLVKLQKPVEEEVIAYSADDIDALFSNMTPGEKLVYTFFLHSGCREQEVQYATWQDLNLKNRTYRVTGQGKSDVGFVPKNHEIRTVPLTSKLVSMLEEYKKSAPDSRWVFVSKNGKPDGHMLRKFKAIAKRADLNCGECETEITEWHLGSSKKVEASCLTRPLCEKHYLHRLRKTCATRWLQIGIDLMKIRTYLGHKSLATTQKYLEGAGKVDNVLQSKIDAAGA